MVGFGGGRAGRQHQIEGGKDAQGQARLCFIGTSIGGERSAPSPWQLTEDD